MFSKYPRQMKTFLTFLLILSSVCCYSQSIVVEYMQEVNSKNAKDKSMLPPPIVSTLVVKDYESFHSFKPSDEYINTIDKIQDAINTSEGDANNPKTIDLQFGISPDLFTYKNREKDLYFEEAMMIFTKVKIHDHLLDFKWNIIPNETKKIGNYLCRKAISQYRDELYTAWFSDKIPISNGPYEFGGLPGLILQVENNESIISATKIIKKSNDFTYEFPAIPNKESSMLSLALFNTEELKKVRQMREDAKAGKPFVIDFSQN